MFRIDSDTAVLAKPAPGAPGVPGYFTNGNPGPGLPVPATNFNAQWCNRVQEEIVAPILSAGLALDSADDGQLLKAINILKRTMPTLDLTGSTSGTISLKPQAIAGTYNFNLPTGAGAGGAPLLSGGGGSSPMTWGTVTGSGNFVMSASPTLTGTVNAADITASGLVRAGFGAWSLRGTLTNVANGAWTTIWTPGVGSYRATGGAGCSSGGGGATVDASKDNGTAIAHITSQVPYGGVVIDFRESGGVLQIRQTSAGVQTIDWSLLIIPHSVV